MAVCGWTVELAAWIVFLAQPLDARICGRLAPLLWGVLWAKGRRTVSRWITAAGLSDDWQRYYYFLGPLGRKAKQISTRLLWLLIRHLPGEEGAFVRLALDDTPTRRYGPEVEGAGLHHDPTPGPSDAKLLYGHVWVTLSWLARHPAWGVIGLPLRSLLYIRRCDIRKGLLFWRRPWEFRTKLELAAELVEWAAPNLARLGKRLLLVCDGAYAKREFLSRAQAAGVVVVSRLRKDAALRDLPPARRAGQRGRPRKYGPNRLSLSGKAAHRHGWDYAEFTLYGMQVWKRYKTFLATYPPAGGVIRVVIVKEDDGWKAFFSTDPELSVAEILEAVADRFAIEQDFHDLKEVHGAGQQQVRNIWVNVAVWHVQLWLFTLIELWAWSRPADELVDRSARPWDDAARRPSHADRRQALRRTCLSPHFSHLSPAAAELAKSPTWLQALWQLLTAV
jgi:hypothetical protein